jgi:3-hydroxybutyryl-CoA dehydrogenase
MEIKKIGVCGAGIMGHGIAQVIAMKGIPVVLMDVTDAILDRAFGNIRKSLARFVKKEKISESDAEGVVSRIARTTELRAVADGTDVVIEAVPEVLELKKETFAELDRLSEPHVILATNTSQFSITAIASVTSRRDKVIGTHWFNPPVIMKLVEIVCGLETSPETLEITATLCRDLGKESVVCRKDSPGFITTRMISLWANEAHRIFEEGIASMEDIDKACRLAFGHRMGPFETNDLVGLDTSLKVREALFQVFGDRFRLQQVVKNYVAAGYLGRKTGRGFYRYDTEYP